jgi:hypothetical protein
VEGCHDLAEGSGGFAVQQPLPATVRVAVRLTPLRIRCSVWGLRSASRLTNRTAPHPSRFQV